MENYIYGHHACIEAISMEKCLMIYLSKAARDQTQQQVQRAANARKIPIRYIPKEAFKKFTKENHQYVVALISPIEFIDMSNFIDEHSKGTEPMVVALLDGVTDVGNLGNLIRTAEFLGVNLLVVPKTGSARLTEKVIRASSGAAFSLNIAQVDHIKDAIYLLKSYDFSIYGASEKKSTSLIDVKFDRLTAVILGDESKGIKPSILGLCDQIIGIPKFGKIDSLNVSSASAILFFEIIRQHHNA
ncbi:MAG: 23S rRNA (guanosine(2251)-2'-O)-methyltransferase RlmB [Proteobacteria bacterium]|nr:23S rRNA (guanosine(2251)-2'-O)-methyltransferase RlmB [Pseudomonadota bacterium]